MFTTLRKVSTASHRIARFIMEFRWTVLGLVVVAVGIVSMFITIPYAVLIAEAVFSVLLIVLEIRKNLREARRTVFLPRPNDSFEDVVDRLAGNVEGRVLPEFGRALFVRRSGHVRDFRDSWLFNLVGASTIAITTDGRLVGTQQSAANMASRNLPACQYRSAQRSVCWQMRLVLRVRRCANAFSDYRLVRSAVPKRPTPFISTDLAVRQVGKPVVHARPGKGCCPSRRCARVNRPATMGVWQRHRKQRFMTRTTQCGSSQVATDESGPGRTHPTNAWRQLGRDVGNAALATVYRVSPPDPAPRAGPVLPVQRDPKLDPTKVAAAADQAHRSDDAAQALNALRWILTMAGPFPMMAALLRLQLMMGVPVGVDSAGSPVKAHVFPGQIADVAMVVAGVHGSEQSGVEVAERLVTQLIVSKPYYTVVVVPRLFPGNVASREEWEQKLAKKQSGIAVSKYQELRDKAGDVGRTTPGQVDPNREFPDLGKSLDLDKPVDAQGRLIEPSNLALLGLINSFKPSRVVSIHAIKNFTEAGIFADPHPSVKGFETDPTAKEADELALTMAKEADKRGVHVGGNKRGTAWSSLYPGQDPKMSAAQIKREDAKGRSFGQWGPSQGMAVITVEVGEQYRSDSAVKDPNRATELEAEATVIREIFLGPPTTAPTSPAAPAAPGQPVQRMLVTAAATNAGNVAAAGLVQRFQEDRHGRGSMTGG